MAAKTARAAECCTWLPNSVKKVNAKATMKRKKTGKNCMKVRKMSVNMTTKMPKRGILRISSTSSSHARSMATDANCHCQTYRHETHGISDISFILQ